MESKRITRRTVLGGVAALPIAATMTTSAKAEDADLIAAYDEWQQCEEAFKAALDIDSAASTKAYAAGPARPAKLAFPGIPGSVMRPMDIRRLVDDPKERQRLLKEAERFWPEHDRIIAAELERLGYPELEAQSEARGDEAAEAFVRLVEMPAKTVNGLCLKLRAACVYWGLTEKNTGPDSNKSCCDEERVTFVAMRDAEHLAGRAVS